MIYGLNIVDLVLWSLIVLLIVAGLWDLLRRRKH